LAMAASSRPRWQVLPVAGNTSDQARDFLQGRLRLVAGLVGLICLGFLIIKPAIGLIFYSGPRRFSYVTSPSVILHVLATAVVLGNWALLRIRQLDARALLVDDVLCTVAVTTLLALMGGGILGTTKRSAMPRLVAQQPQSPGPTDPFSAPRSSRPGRSPTRSRPQP
jgi:hypothetical protein